MLSLLPHTPDDVMAQLTGCAEPLPRRADAVVVGGGIIGLAAAYFLAERGLRAVVLEQARPAALQSGRNWGFVRSQYRDPLEMPLAAAALALWPGLEARLGMPMGWRQQGCLFVAGSEAEQAAHRRWLEKVADQAPTTRLLSPAEVAASWPSLGRASAGALFSPEDGQAEPALASRAFLHAAQRLGARVIEDCSALAIEASGGRVRGVRTEHGSIASDVVICAAGAASRGLLAGLGLWLPQQVVRSTVSLTAPLAGVIDPCFCGFGIGLRQRADGSCIVAADGAADIDLDWGLLRDARHYLPSFVRHRHAFTLGLARPGAPRTGPNQMRVVETMRRFGALFGLQAPVSVVKSWAGQIDLLPDALPVIDAPERTLGLIVATGFSGHGFGLAPAVGQVIAQLATGKAAAQDLAPFRLDRFETGRAGRPFGPL
ncbi:FAD-binding oxidoreductase [Roseomonas aerophila]|uniref:FAD-binding oxidoreductase n=1 Tax=Teichococcus aerophilus TaxID=1224513 RepID=A0ABR7RRK1_9PROT|nr:FAD-binding oxidoreductase [Pseudoroseomonas aerophila]MBC9208973.1 FAD-binding oxidoreductase [Pseudoroseomonas aerophila]